MVAGSQTGPQADTPGARWLTTSKTRDEIEVMSQRQLIWRRFRRHRLAMAATVVVALFYLIVIFSDFLATNDPEDIEAARQYTPPQWLRLFDGWKPDLHVCKLVGKRDEFLRKVYEADCDQKVDVQTIRQRL